MNHCRHQTRNETTRRDHAPEAISSNPGSPATRYPATS